MKITQIRAYQVDLPLKEGRYSWSNGNFVEVFDSTVVEIGTDEGLTALANAVRSVPPIFRPTLSACAPACWNWRRGFSVSTP